MKLLRVIIKILGWSLIFVGGISLPVVLYQLYCVIWGGALEGDIMYLDTFAPSKARAIAEAALFFSIIILGMALEHFGTRAIDRITRNKQN
ncbi:MAG: hypothetical protein HY888_02235 [Deltaproteobacteria bacterium]|nr:hypothetical protein [Deltaproteobacteria bacterium]